MTAADGGAEVQARVDRARALRRLTGVEGARAVGKLVDRMRDVEPSRARRADAHAAGQERVVVDDPSMHPALLESALNAYVELLAGWLAVRKWLVLDLGLPDDGSGGHAAVDLDAALQVVADVRQLDRYVGHRASYVLRGECGYSGDGSRVCRQPLGHNRPQDDGAPTTWHEFVDRAEWDR